jgi:nitrate/TMAO reductase-like tetraheme cytochrome c subunit
MERALNGHAAGCEACHSTKTWNELTRFDHEQTSFPLTGAHRAVACIDCHKPPDLETKMVHADFRSTPQQCEDCHANIHGPQFAKAGGVTSCGECHSTARWKPSLFDHDRSTHFALQGLHRNVRCADCHKLTKLVEGKRILFYKPTPTDCKACHGADVPLPKKGS